MKLLSRFFLRKPAPKTEQEIAALIDGFANGTGGRWDWDYFISTDFENERVTWAQKECLKVEDEFPRRCAPLPALRGAAHRRGPW
jgi:hypothetical protein